MSDHGTPNTSAAQVKIVGSDVASGAADSGNPTKVGGVYNSTPPTLDTGDRGDVQLDSRGNLKTSIWNADGSAGADVAAAAGADSQSNTVDVLLTRAYGMKHNGASWDRDRKPSNVGRLPASANTNNATSLKASAGDLHHINGLNATAGVKYLKLYNKASAPTVGTDTPFLTLALPASAPFSFNFPGGLYMSTGIAYGIVTGAADADNTAVAANDILGLNIAYA